jgi:transcriptional regulator GlxA family with amidase domain
MEKKIKVGVLLFNEVEVLDFAGPFEVFSVACFLNTNERAFEVSTVGETGEMILARNGLKVEPHYSFINAPDYDVLIVPGGYGADEVQRYNSVMIDWILECDKHVDILASVCTGAFILAEAGLLNEKRATTHWMDLDTFQAEYPRIHVERAVKFVDEGNIITAGGISAGINMSLHIVSRLLGADVARETAKRMEYDLVL